MRAEPVRIADIAEQIRGVTYRSDEATTLPAPGYLPILRAGNIQDEGLDLSDLVFVPAARVSPKQKLRPHDVVIATSSGSLQVVGKAARVVEAFDGGFGAFCKVLRPNTRVVPSYFGHFFQTPTYRKTVSSLAAGANINNLRNEHLDELLIPLPPLREHRRLAEILDKADALRAKRRAALAALEGLEGNLFLESFGDPILNRLGWPLVKLGLVGQLDRGVSKHRPRNAPELLGGPYPFVQTGDVANCDGYLRSFNSTYSENGLRQSKLWPAGTLCITIAANIAKTGILTFDACFPDSVVGFRAEEPATVEFIRVWLSFWQARLEEAAPEFAQKNINLAILRDLEVPVPPLDLQRDFARRIAAIEALKTSHRSSLAALDSLFASLQHLAFSGGL
ncbi:MAG: restriction endonuclease subunit S [Thermoanaerobaculia bacterium]|nr:restriction endonuclease subunit S [Thermoanaerobaculia bacterium]